MSNKFIELLELVAVVIIIVATIIGVHEIVQSSPSLGSFVDFLLTDEQVGGMIELLREVKL